jgi:hypothetical protein
MGKTRHKNPRTAMRYVKPGAEAIAKVTEVLAPRRRNSQPRRWPSTFPPGRSAGSDEAR